MGGVTIKTPWGTDEVKVWFEEHAKRGNLPEASAQALRQIDDAAMQQFTDDAQWAPDALKAIAEQTKQHYVFANERCSCGKEHVRLNSIPTVVIGPTHVERD